MKKTILLLALFCAFFNINAQDINGLWADSSGSSFSNCNVIFAVKNDSVFMTHYLEFNGTPFVEYGSGIIKGDSLTYKVTVSKGIPGWSTAGVHTLKLSADGNTLRGSYSDNKGNHGPLVFKRQLSTIKKGKNEPKTH